jgi:Autotransporter beta-domain
MAPTLGNRLRRRAGLLALTLAMGTAAGGATARAAVPDDAAPGWDAAPMTEVPGIVVVPGLPEPDPQGKGPFGGVTGIPAPRQSGGTEVKLQWRSERYVPGGAEGLEVDGNTSGVEIGVSYKLKSAVSIGAQAQFDPAGETLVSGQRSLSDHAWMAGPVATVNVAPGLVLEARAAWGLAESAADELHAGSPAAQRRFLSARLTNPHALGAWRFTPSINFSQAWEGAAPVAGQGPSQAPGQVSAEHMVGSGRVDIAPEIAYRFEFARSAFIEPKAVLGGFWAFDDLTKSTPGVGTHTEPRLKAEAGVTFGVVDGVKLEALGGVEGGDATTPDVWTGRLQLSVPLK